MTEQFAEFEKFFAPFKELNAITLVNVEKLVEMQLKSLEENTRVGLEQLKNAAAVNDLESLKSYLSTQAEVTKKAADRAVQDSRNFMELGNSYSSEVQRVVKNSLSVN